MWLGITMVALQMFLQDKYVQHVISVYHVELVSIISQMHCFLFLLFPNNKSLSLMIAFQLCRLFEILSLISQRSVTLLLTLRRCVYTCLKSQYLLNPNRPTKQHIYVPIKLMSLQLIKIDIQMLLTLSNMPLLMIITLVKL